MEGGGEEEGMAPRASDTAWVKKKTEKSRGTKDQALPGNSTRSERE